jgi:hypothetical protein
MHMSYYEIRGFHGNESAAHPLVTGKYFPLLKRPEGEAEHSHQAPKLRISEPPVPPHAFMASTETISFPTAMKL